MIFARAVRIQPWKDGRRLLAPRPILRRQDTDGLVLLAMAVTVVEMGMPIPMI